MAAAVKLSAAEARIYDQDCLLSGHIHLLAAIEQLTNMRRAMAHSTPRRPLVNQINVINAGLRQLAAQMEFELQGNQRRVDDGQVRRAEISGSWGEARENSGDLRLASGAGRR